MKTSKEWAEIYMISPVLTLKDAFKMAQEEAIEEAVKACAESAMIECERYSNKTSIRSVINGKSTYSVDKQSILNVEKQLKSKL